MIVVNPNNPTGSFLKRAELDAMAEMCAARGIAMIFRRGLFGTTRSRPIPNAPRPLTGVEQCLAFSMRRAFEGGPGCPR